MCQTRRPRPRDAVAHLADLQAEIDRREREEEELEKRERVLNRTMLTRVRGVPRLLGDKRRIGRQLSPKMPGQQASLQQRQ